MKKKSNSKIIYKVTHRESGKSYVGVTSRSLEIRKVEHLKDAEKKSPYSFHQAIATHGPEAFIWDQIDTACSVDELAEKEKHYIVKYNSQNNGYNVDSGGGFMKTVYQYSIDNGVLVNKYSRLEDAANSIDSIKQCISRACLSGTNLYGGFYWSYNYDEPFIPGKDRRFKKVVQIDLNNDWVANYKSVAEASRKTGFSKSCIARVCRGERGQTHGFLFKYE